MLSPNFAALLSSFRLISSRKSSKNKKLGSIKSVFVITFLAGLLMAFVPVLPV